MTCAIVPAAGGSRRMGRPKLLLPYGDTTVVGALLGSLRQAGVERVVLVIAAADEALRSWARETATEIAVNPEPERGMLSSITCGLEALGGAAAIAAADQPLLVTPADLPAIDPDTIRRLLIELRAGSPPTLAVPVFDGKRGHPLAIAGRLAVEIAALDSTRGLRQLLDRHPVVELAVDDPGVVLDVDTPSDYESLEGARLRPP